MSNISGEGSCMAWRGMGGVAVGIRVSLVFIVQMVSWVGGACCKGTKVTGGDVAC